MTREERYRRVLDYFAAAMPDAGTELHYGSVFQLLVAVVLSAQCTDKRVNQVTPRLFGAYPDAVAMAAATADEVLPYISSVSYPRSKSEHLVGLARMLVEEYGGEVPREMEQLLRLPGVGRKTANVMLAVAFDRPAMPVDTHVFRVANRIGLATRARTPLQVEQALVANTPQALLARAHHWLILHGRYVCTARKPHCGECGLTEVCRHHAAQRRAAAAGGQTKGGGRAV